MLNYGTDRINEYSLDTKLFRAGYQKDWADGADPGNIANPSDAQARIGVEPLDTYPSKWFNQFENFNSRNINMASVCFLDLYAELMFVLQMAGIVPQRLSHTQVYEAILQIIKDFDISDHKITFSKALVYEQIQSNESLRILFGKLMVWFEHLVAAENNIDKLFADLEAEIQRAKTAETNLGTRITNEENRAKGVENGLLSRATALENRCTTIETNITNLQSRASSLESRASSLESRATTVESRITTVEGRTKYGPDGTTIVYNGNYWTVSENWVKQVIAANVSASWPGGYRTHDSYTFTFPGQVSGHTYLKKGIIRAAVVASGSAYLVPVTINTLPLLSFVGSSAIGIPFISGDYVGWDGFPITGPIAILFDNLYP